MVMYLTRKVGILLVRRLKDNLINPHELGCTGGTWITETNLGVVGKFVCCEVNLAEGAFAN